MGNKKSSKAMRTSLFTSGSLMMVVALVFWISDTGSPVLALCFAASGFCFLAAGLNAKGDKDDKDKS